MSENATVDVRPTKRFFIDNLTRDITLEDAILDLVDNAIDAVIVRDAVNVSSALLSSPSSTKSPTAITVDITTDEFRISDNSGGIDIDHARRNVFRLGRPPEHGSHSALGVFGIGLKRAIFKIGASIAIESKTMSNGFRVEFDVLEWSKDDDNWTIPLTSIEPATSPQEAGTTIVVRALRDEVALRIGDGTLITHLQQAIASSYTLFLNSLVTVTLNASHVGPTPLPLGTSEELEPTVQHYQWNGVDCEMLVGLQARVGGEWNAERGGWYVVCNGRVVVFADKTELSGWGVFGPTFVSKFRGFVGIAFFFSDEPADLPWTTTKRGLNRDSRVFQVARREMSQLGKPVLAFLSSMYPSEPAEAQAERKLADGLKQATLVDLLEGNRKREFKVPARTGRTQKQKTVSVQFEADKSVVERIKKFLNRPRWSAGRIGQFTMDHFVKRELGE